LKTGPGCGWQADLPGLAHMQDASGTHRIGSCALRIAWVASKVVREFRGA
jgi:hypothetical protein